MMPKGVILFFIISQAECDNLPLHSFSIMFYFLFNSNDRMKRILRRWLIIVGLLFCSKIQLQAQPGCSPVSLPHFEDFENGFFLSSGYEHLSGGICTTYVLPDHCWLQCRRCEDGWDSMCGWEYYFPGPVRNVYLRFGQYLINEGAMTKMEALAATPVLENSPSGISFKACYNAMTMSLVPSGSGVAFHDTTLAEGTQILIGYTTDDAPIQVIPNPHTELDQGLSQYDPAPYIVTNYEPDHNFVPIDTITVYSTDYEHYDVLHSNFKCKGVTVPPHSRLVFQSANSIEWGGSVRRIEFHIDSLTIYGDYMPPDSIVSYKDTICAGQSYEGYGFSIHSIQNPGTFVFDQWECVGNRSILHQLTLTVKTRKTTYFSYTITPGDSIYFEDTTFTDAGSYTFNYTGFNGCDSLVILHISYNWDGVENNIWVPSAFTPNGDGLNDVFMPVFTYPERVDVYRLEIYDRIGGRIFATRRKDQGWDGEGCPDGVYPYVIRYSFLGEQRQEKRGMVVLLH